ncbi:MAG: Lar family restriction alleviation protein [Treponema sp.]|jgi:Lar family restriction alleviation protein|nr:Lar family restriction alleviation protein [Treponema sp.]
MNSELKSCPFCGGEPQSTRETTFDKWWVFCKKCFASGGRRKSEAEGIAAWNNRDRDFNGTFRWIPLDNPMIAIESDLFKFRCSKCTGVVRIETDFCPHCGYQLRPIFEPKDDN